MKIIDNTASGSTLSLEDLPAGECFRVAEPGAYGCVWLKMGSTVISNGEASNECIVVCRSDSIENSWKPTPIPIDTIVRRVPATLALGEGK